VLLRLARDRMTLYTQLFTHPSLLITAESVAAARSLFPATTTAVCHIFSLNAVAISPLSQRRQHSPALPAGPVPTKRGQPELPPPNVVPILAQQGQPSKAVVMSSQSLDSE